MKLNNSISNYLNLLRWISAFFVVSSHLRSFIFVDYNDVENITLLDKIFYFVTGLGHQAVIVFFVLSGFLIGVGILSKSNFEFKEYLIKRFVRIYIVMISALIIGFLLDYFGSHYINYNGLYNNFFHISAMDYDVSKRLSFNTFILNILMMQNSLATTFGSNGPLWSLANEWWYYILLPLIIFIFKGKKTILSLIVSILLYYVLDINILIYFSIWLMGVLVFKYNYNFDIPFKNILSLLLVLIVLVLIKVKMLSSGFLPDLILSLSIAFLINNLIFSKNNKTYFDKINTLMSNFSYSLYLFHFPFIVFVVSLISIYITPIIKIQPDFMHYCIYFLILFTTYLYSFLMYKLFENQTNSVRNKLFHFFGLSK